MLDRLSEIRNGTGILWKIEKPGVADSVLFGATPAHDVRALLQLARIKPFLARSRIAVVEIDYIHIDPAKTKKTIQALSLLPEGESLSRNLSDEETRVLKKLVEDMGMNWEIARRVRPNFLMFVLGVPVCQQFATPEKDHFLEAVIVEMALKADIPVTAMDTIEDQFAAFAGLDPEIQLAAIVEAADIGPKWWQDRAETLIALYSEGRVGLMSAWPETEGDRHRAWARAQENIRARLIEDRSPAMLEKAMGELMKGGAFVSVNAQHLPGDAGFVELIRKRGFSVTPIK
jgi:hypothetical protein